jgi:hypothetical protein
MDGWYLLDCGTPFLSIVSASDAAELFASTPPERRSGSVADGFAYWVDTRNGLDQAVRYTTRATPIPPGRLAEICQRVSRFSVLPKELRTWN